MAAKGENNGLKKLRNGENIRTLPQMKVDSTSAPFSDIHESGSYNDRTSASYSATNQNPVDFIDEFLDPLQKGDSILDLGSGPSVFAEHMHSRNFQVTGIELSEKMIEYARNRYPDIDFRLGDMAKLPFAAENFGGIFASYSLIHPTKEAIPSIVEKLYEILNQGWIIYLSVQPGNSTEGLFSHPATPGGQVFLNILPRRRFADCCQDAGLR